MHAVALAEAPNFAHTILIQVLSKLLRPGSIFKLKLGDVNRALNMGDIKRRRNALISERVPHQEPANLHLSIILNPYHSIRKGRLVLFGQTPANHVHIHISLKG
jgi:hypothetical protein